ncbi:MAG: tRNA pseudouridine(13) synthase TruD [Pseudomonadales bacterium]|nr:tRNA pseudouridine(13) synthase TruD [Pseudomonadales bacterium]
MIPDWPRAWDGEPATGRIRSEPDDFQVFEIPSFTPTGEGEHLLVHVEKVNLTTTDLVAHLAATHGIADTGIGYAGMKDKRARTRQWLSLPVADYCASPVCTADGAEFQVLQMHRHQRKLRRGDLLGNRFDIRVRAVGKMAALLAGLEAVTRTGVPNYFGAQRFGRSNIEDAVRWLGVRRRRRVSRFQQGLYLSVLRSLLFNEVLAARVRAGNWDKAIPGDVMAAGYPTGPLWGRGRSGSTREAVAIENSVLDAHRAICEGLEFSGVVQGRRSLVLMPDRLRWEVLADDELRLSFGLPAGGYATTLLSELLELQT